MQIKIHSQQNNHMNFGMSYKMTDKATQLLNKKKFSAESINRIENALDNISKLKKVSVTFDSYDDKLLALIYSDEGYLRIKHENILTTIFKKTVKFIENVNKDATDAENMFTTGKVKLIKK